MPIVVHVFLAAAIVFIALYNIFSASPQWFDGGAKLADIFYNLSLSYVVSYIFFLVAMLPQRRKEKMLQGYVINCINDIVNYRDIVLWNLVKIDRDIQEVTFGMVRVAFDNWDFSAESNIYEYGKKLTWYEYFAQNIELSNTAGEKLKSYAMNVDARVLKLVNSILDSWYFRVARGSMQHPEASTLFNPQNRATLAQEFWDYSRCVDELDELTMGMVRPSLIQRMLAHLK